MNETALVTAPAMAMPGKDILSFCATLPDRDLEAVRDGILQVATVDAETARRCIYCKPAGKVKDTQRQKFVLGESIRLAEIAQSQFKRMWINSQIVEETDKYVVVNTVCFDMQTLNMTNAMERSPIYGDPSNAIGRAQSISRRNAILQHVRPQTAAILEPIKQKVIGAYAVEGDTGLKDVRDRLRNEVRERFGDISDAEFDAIESGEKRGQDKVVLLIGIMNALEDGNVTIEKVVGREVKQKTPPPRKAAQDKKQEQTAKQRFATFQLQATQKLGDVKVDEILKNLCEKSGVTISKWSDEQHDVASNALADALGAANVA